MRECGADAGQKTSWRLWGGLAAGGLVWAALLAHTTNAERAKEAFRNVIRSRIPNQRAEAEFENFCALCEEERYLRE